MHADITPIRVALITLDGHLGNTIDRAQTRLRREIPGLSLTMHPACDWGENAEAEAACNEAIANADIIVCTMMFLDAHINQVLPALQARAPHCDALVGAMSGTEIVKLTRMGKLTMGGELKGPMGYLKKSSTNLEFLMEQLNGYEVRSRLEWAKSDILLHRY